MAKAPIRARSRWRKAHGYPLAQHRARQVQAVDFDDFDLVLAMDRVNLRALQRHRPRADAREAALFLPHVGFRRVSTTCLIPTTAAAAISSACWILRAMVARY